MRRVGAFAVIACAALGLLQMAEPVKAEAKEG